MDTMSDSELPDDNAATAPADDAAPAVGDDATETVAAQTEAEQPAGAAEDATAVLDDAVLDDAVLDDAVLDDEVADWDAEADWDDAVETGLDDAPHSGGDDEESGRGGWRSALQAAPTRRILLLTALGGLLIAGLVTAVPMSGGNSMLGYLAENGAVGSRGTDTFNKAVAGDCLTWDKNPDHATIVDCGTDHLFEVAKPIDLGTFPGAEYGPDAAPPTSVRIQQIVAEQCQVAVRNYLGPHFDPDSRYTVSMLWPGEDAWRSSGDRRMLCGLQLPGENAKQLTFIGKIAESDQSKVWPVGTCLGISPTTNQSTDSPVDCGTAHAAEITGIVDLSQQFPAGAPDDAAQDGFIKEQCTKLTDAYLAPVQLRNTTLTLMYKTISMPSWSAGSHQVACSIGATLGNGGWSTLVNSAKGNLQINGQAPVPPPDIPSERLTLPSVPVVPTYIPQYEPPASQNQSSTGSQNQSSTGSQNQSSTGSQNQSSTGSQNQSSNQGNQHMPAQSTPSPAASPSPTATNSGGPKPPQGNTFNPPAPGAPAPPAGDGPAMDGPAADGPADNGPAPVGPAPGA